MSHTDGTFSSPEQELAEYMRRQDQAIAALLGALSLPDADLHALLAGQLTDMDLKKAAVLQAVLDLKLRFIELYKKLLGVTESSPLGLGVSLSVDPLEQELRMAVPALLNSSELLLTQFEQTLK